MMGKTHKAGGALGAVLAIQFVASNPYVTGDMGIVSKFLVTYPWTLMACTWSDLDLDWSCVEDKNPLNLAIYKMLHIFNGAYDRCENSDCSKRKKFILRILKCSHRSWQTHSDLTLVLLLLMLKSVTSGGILSKLITQMDCYVISLALTGILIGVISHLFLDMLNPEGIKCILFTVVYAVYLKIRYKNLEKFKFIPLKLVPNSSKFNADTDYGKFIGSVLRTTSYLYALSLALIYVLTTTGVGKKVLGHTPDIINRIINTVC